MYLVVLRFAMDDLPVRLFDQEQAAKDFAKQLSYEPTEEIRRVFETDCSIPDSVAVVQFVCTAKHELQGASYEPIALFQIKRHENEPAECSL